ncbi:MAG: XRE family transcriptional regulator [Gemmiger sp.]|uniref:LexA family protein n=1 Tax=Gemmiger sp. TaxID=2049027 RepID=UPI002E767FA5|nr:XRE family transcriptional regulator [Gemmiger sp.]MEE0800276.1 XRE family transcriptional regulator [Gemmiger sp.]
MFSERLKEARKAKRYSQAEVSRLLGVTQQAVGKWETGRSTPDPQTVARLAEILDTTADVLLGLQSASAELRGAVGQRAFSRYTQCPIPVVGTVRAGYGSLAFEEDYGSEYASVKDPQNYFYLVVKGDSMEPRISDGDLALVHKQNTLDNGDLGVMVYGSDGNGTLKKYIQRGDSVVLHPFNPNYEDLIIRGEELDHLYIAGKVVETKAKW